MLGYKNHHLSEHVLPHGLSIRSRVTSAPANVSAAPASTHVSINLGMGEQWGDQIKLPALSRTWMRSVAVAEAQHPYQVTPVLHLTFTRAKGNLIWTSPKTVRVVRTV